MASGNQFAVLGCGAPAAAIPPTAAVPGTPLGAQRAPRDVGMSKNLMGLKFMQRSKQRAELAQQEQAAACQVKKASNAHLHTFHAGRFCAI